MHKPSKEISIDNKVISLENKTYFIAEIGSNFDQDMERAKDLIYLARDAGADAVKFQHYTAETLVSDQGFKALGAAKSHQAKWKKSVFDTYKDASLNKEWTASLKEICDKAGITFFSSPYSFELVNFIDPYVPAYKVGSGDITWPAIIQHMAKKGKPVMISSGASTLEDVKRAVDCALVETPDLVLMQCNTNYLASTDNFSHIHLNVLKSFERLYPGIILGLSDHMPGHTAVLGAVALGARVIEKHFTDSVEREGPDHSFAMDPVAWQEMVKHTRELEASLGDFEKKIEPNEEQTVIAQRRCIRAKRDLESGKVLVDDDLEVLRPCPPNSIQPFELDSLLGKTLKTSIMFGEHLKWSDVHQS